MNLTILLCKFKFRVKKKETTAAFLTAFYVAFVVVVNDLGFYFCFIHHMFAVK